jgi:hypothetical protein
MVTPGFLVGLAAAIIHNDAGRTQMVEAIVNFLGKLII